MGEPHAVTATATPSSASGTGPGEGGSTMSTDGMGGMGWKRDLPDVRDYTSDATDVARVLTRSKPLKAAAGRLPRTVNLREWCSPVEDQGSLGSCTANAGIGLLEYLQRRAFGRYLDGSRLFLYKVTRALLGWTGDQGAYLRRPMRGVVLSGAPPEPYWRYDAGKFDEEPPAFCYAFGQSYKAIRYYRLDPPGTPPGGVLAGGGRREGGDPLPPPRRPPRGRACRRCHRLRRRENDRKGEGSPAHPQLLGDGMGGCGVRLAALRLCRERAGGGLLVARGGRFRRHGAVPVKKKRVPGTADPYRLHLENTEKQTLGDLPGRGTHERERTPEDVIPGAPVPSPRDGVTS